MCAGCEDKKAVESLHAHVAIEAYHVAINADHVAKHMGVADFSSHGLSLLHWRCFGCGIIRCCRCSTRHAAAPWLGVQLSGHWHLPPYPTLAAPAVPVWVDCSLSTECRHLECPATPAPLRGTATHVDGDGGAAPRHGGHNSNHNTSSENAKA